MTYVYMTFFCYHGKKIGAPYRILYSMYTINDAIMTTWSYIFIIDEYIIVCTIDQLRVYSAWSMVCQRPKYHGQNGYKSIIFNPIVLL